MPMPFQIRSSKFRHVYGSPFRKEKCFENVRLTRNAHDSNFCAVNPKFLAVVVESAGGGSFLCLPTDCPGRVDVTAPKISGHAGNVLDIKWSPFSDHVIASCSDDNTVKVWQVPEDGLKTNLTEWIVDLHGHTRRATYIEWHPTAENVLLSTAMDFKCVLWNIEQAEPINIINCHPDTVFSMSWNRDGSMMATTCKDRKIRVIDPRKGGVAVETNGHIGNKASKVIYLGDTSKVFTTGFDRMSNRQCALWDVKNMKTPVRLLDIDSSSGVILPYYDYDSRMVYLAGKGDGNIRYYEIEDDNEAIHYLNVYQSPLPQRGFGVMPKRGCDATKCEVMRFYKMLAAKDMVEPISMIAPRKSHKFHDDLFPPTASMIPSLSADEWISGQNRDPILMSLLDGHITNSPKYTSANAVQMQDGTITLPPTITTYKALNPVNNNEPVARTTNNIIQSVGGVRDSRKEPASLKNIKRLSTNEDFVSINEVNDTNGKQVVPLDLDQDKPMTDQNQNERKTVKKVWTPTTPTNEVTTNGFSGPDSDPSSPTLKTNSTQPFDDNQSDTPPNVIPSPTQKSMQTSTAELLLGYHPPKHILEEKDHNALLYNVYNTSPVSVMAATISGLQKVHVKKVWSTPKASLPPIMHQWRDQPHSEIELKKAYFNQIEEIKSLKEQINLKDKRIRQLEEEINILKSPRCGPGESDC